MKQGFTLIELLVVIAIISILSVTVLTSLNSARERAQDAARVAELHQIKLALDLYYEDNGVYPDDNTDTWNMSNWKGSTSLNGLKNDLAPYFAFDFQKPLWWGMMGIG